VCVCVCVCVEPAKLWLEQRKELAERPTQSRAEHVRRPPISIVSMRVCV
jgi:hypothetical protein